MRPATRSRARRSCAAPLPHPAPVRHATARALAAAIAGAVLVLLLHAAPAGAVIVRRCWVPDVGGVVEFPPLCVDGYQSRDGVVGIENGLPPGSALLARHQLRDFRILLRTPGGPLGGELQDWTANLFLDLTGTGGYAGYVRTVVIPLTGKTASGPQVPGSVVQAFPTDLFECFGQLTGDPDFALLRFTAGTNYGLPSPGQGVFTYTPEGDWSGDSFFDIAYRVDFVGDPLGPFAFLSGSTTSQMRVRSGMPHPHECSAPEIGTGTAAQPPPCGGWTSEPQTLLSLSGLPPGIPLEANLRLSPTGPFIPIGAGELGGDILSGSGAVDVEIIPLNLMSAMPYTVSVPVTLEFDLGPEMPGVPRQGVAGRLKRLTGQIVNDPVFALLRFTGGYDFGLAGTEGHVTLTHGPGGTWFVDSFFDIVYRVDLVGEPMGPLSGIAGSDVVTHLFTMGDRDRPACVMPDNGAGTADFPPLCPPGYEGLVHRPAIENGMPPGNLLHGTLHLGVPAPPLVAPGGTLGGEMAQCAGQLQIDLESFVSGYARKVVIPAQWVFHSAPRSPGTTPQRFETDLFELFAQVIGDPDFDLLRIVGGTNFGYPGPGHTTFSQTAALDWSVDSFFDITYRIDFVGAIGGPFQGMSGSTTVVDRIVAGAGTVVGSPVPPVPGAQAAFALSTPAPNPTRDGAHVWLDLPSAGHVRAGVYDVAGRHVASLVDRAFEAGRHEIAWDGRESGGQAARAGMYFLRVRTDAGGADRAVVLVR